MKSFFLVCFDVRDERRRQRLSSELENFGNRVQRSVFECSLDDAELAELKRRVAGLIDATEDHVRYYALCDKDVSDILIDGSVGVTSDPDFHVL